VATICILREGSLHRETKRDRSVRADGELVVALTGAFSPDGGKLGSLLDADRSNLAVEVRRVER
jgi:hypothetical protein